MLFIASGVHKHAFSFYFKTSLATETLIGAGPSQVNLELPGEELTHLCERKREQCKHKNVVIICKKYLKDIIFPSTNNL